MQQLIRHTCTTLNPICGVIYYRPFRNIIAVTNLFRSYNKSLKKISVKINISPEYWKPSLKTICRIAHERDQHVFVSPSGLCLFKHGHSLFQESRKGDSNSKSSQEKKDENEDDEDDHQNKWTNLIQLGFAASFSAFLIYLFMDFVSSQKREHVLYISWNDFVNQMLVKGEVEKVVIHPENDTAVIYFYPGAVIQGQKVVHRGHLLKTPEPYKFEEKLREAERSLGIDPKDGTTVSYSYSKAYMRILSSAILGGTVLLLYLAGRKMFSKIKITDIFSQMTKAPITYVDKQTESIDVTFKDIAGLKEAKVEIMEFVDYLKNPTKYKDIGAKIPRGALLLGPPGCGKTLLARAVANEANVPFLAMAGSEFVEMIGGLGASRVRDLFKQAKEKSPAIVYIDEIDAIGKKRASGGDNSEEDHTLNQLLVEMDGIGTQQDVIMLAATNRADLLDQALLRPGRFDRHITIDLPTLLERKETFDIYLNKLKLIDAPSTYSHWLAQLTPGMTGADINNVCNEAAIHAATNSKSHVDKTDLEFAMERVIAGSAKKTSVLSKAEKRIVAFHESGHALVGWLLPTTDALLRISIVPRTSNVLGYAQYNPSDQKLFSQQQLFEQMSMALGGRAAEALVFNHVTTGAQDDLSRVTELAYNQIRSFGMNEKVGLVSYSLDKEDDLMPKPYSKALSAIIDEESRALVAKAYRKAEQLLQSNRPLLEKMADALLVKEVLSYDDVNELIGPPPHGTKNTTAVKWWEGNQLSIHNQPSSTNSQNSDSEPRQTQEKSVDGVEQCIS